MPLLFVVLLHILLPLSLIAQGTPADWRAEAEQIAAAVQKPTIPPNRINIRDFSGIDPDLEGSQDFRPFIQQAIDSLASLGGGTLLFSHTQKPSDWVKPILTYKLSGPIHLKSGIELSFEANTRLFFSFEPENYMLDNGGTSGTLRRYEGTTIFSFSPLIYAFNASDVKISFAGGRGATPIIDGDGQRWQQWAMQQDGLRQQKGMDYAYRALWKLNNQGIPLKDRYLNNLEIDVYRPQLMHFFMCERVEIEGVFLKNAPFWMVHAAFSEDLYFHDMLFDGQVVNNDAFDIESSRNTLIEHVMFNNHDDNLAVKSGRDREGREGVDIRGTALEGLQHFAINKGRLGAPSENVVLRHCVFKGHHALSIGSEMSADVRRVYAYDNSSTIKVENALYLKSSRKRGGTIEHIYFFNNHFNKVKSIAHFNQRYDGDRSSPYFPSFRQVHMNNVSAKEAEEGILLYGWKENPIQNATFFTIQIDSLKKSDKKLDVFNVDSLKVEKYFIGNQEVTYPGKH